ncbi:MAG: folate-binding protein [Burkholderiaceae bacterium]
MNPDPTLEGVTRLTHLGVIRATGAEAQKFLHGQLTNDMLGLDPARARLAGFCSAKGRLQASFVLWKASEDEVQLVCAASVLPATLKRLSMFILRSRCKLFDANDELPVYGIAGGLAAQLAAQATPWQRSVIDCAGLVVLPPVQGVARCLWVGPSPPASAPGTALDLDRWRWLEVQSGVPLIETATVDRFVPQMLNYELIGGVDFQKGCYPGQEIVARSQYRGTIKRRMALFDIDAAAQPGNEVFHSDDPGQPAGMVVNAAPRPDDASARSALVEVKLAALERGSLHLANVDGAVLRPIALPYAVPRETAVAP